MRCGPVVKWYSFGSLRSVVAGSDFRGRDHGIYNWWDLKSWQSCPVFPYVASKCLPDILVIVIQFTNEIIVPGKEGGRWHSNIEDKVDVTIWGMPKKNQSLNDIFPSSKIIAGLDVCNGLARKCQKREITAPINRHINIRQTEILQKKENWNGIWNNGKDTSIDNPVKSKARKLCLVWFLCLMVYPPL